MGDQHVGASSKTYESGFEKSYRYHSQNEYHRYFYQSNSYENWSYGYGSPETTTGGNALKFYASVRIDVRRIATLKQGEQNIGNRVKAKVVKNKVAPPFRVYV